MQFLPPQDTSGIETKATAYKSQCRSVAIAGAKVQATDAGIKSLQAAAPLIGTAASRGYARTLLPALTRARR